MDLGINIAFGDESACFAIQADYAGSIGTDDFQVTYKGNDHEIYFEEGDFDWFEKHLSQFDDIIYVHKPKEYSWGSELFIFTTLIFTL